MSEKTEKSGNILTNPIEYADQLAKLDSSKDRSKLLHLEIHLSHRLRLGGAITYLDEDGHHVIEDRDGIRPFPNGSEFPSPPESAELEIRELAFQNGVLIGDPELENWSEAVSALAGDEIQSDEVEQLVIGLRRLGSVDGIMLTKLHARYLEEILAS